ADNVQSKWTTGEGTAVMVTSSSCSDVVGNIAAGIDSAAFKIDKTAPTVAYMSQSPAANGAGWNNADVVATFTATDTLSGFAPSGMTKTGTSTSSGEGSAVSVDSPAFTDVAGNTAAAGAASHSLKIDKTAPTVAVTSQPPAEDV